MKSIIPSIIAKDQKELDKRFELVKSSSIIHLDIMDGRFVKNHSLNFSFKLPKIKREYQAHLMMKNPKSWIEKHHRKVDTIIFHIESFKKHKQIEEFIQFIKTKKKKVGIAINPMTSVKKILPFLHLINLVLIMTVIPGRYGSRFLPSSLKKSNKIKNNNPKMKVQIDGGIDNKTIIRAKSYADSFVSGSYVQNAKSSKEAINNLEKLANN